MNLKTEGQGEQFTSRWLFGGVGEPYNIQIDATFEKVKEQAKKMEGIGKVLAKKVAKGLCINERFTFNGSHTDLVNSLLSINGIGWRRAGNLSRVLKELGDQK